MLNEFYDSRHPEIVTFDHSTVVKYSSSYVRQDLQSSDSSCRRLQWCLFVLYGAFQLHNSNEFLKKERPYVGQAQPTEHVAMFCEALLWKSRPLECLWIWQHYWMYWQVTSSTRARLLTHVWESILMTLCANGCVWPPPVRVGEGEGAQSSQSISICYCVVRS